MKATVAGLLDPYRDLSSNYGDPGVPLSNHLPMALAALAAMGASDERMSSWAQAQVPRLGLRTADDRERAGRARWRERIARIGARSTLNEAVAALAGGIGAAAFHAVIRAAYALEWHDDDELAAALESWEREYLELPSFATTAVTLETALERLAATSIAVVPEHLIVLRMQQIASSDGFARVASAAPPLSALDEMIVAAAAAFALNQNFTALHVLTGSAAARILTRHLDEPAILMPAFWTAYAAAAIDARVAPTLDPATLAELRADPVPDWDELLAVAVGNDDDHVIKSTYTAWSLDRELNDRIFLVAAARYLVKRGGLIVSQTAKGKPYGRA